MNDTSLEYGTARPAGTAAVGLWAALSSEARKLRTLSFPRILVLLSLAAGLLTAVLFLLTLEVTQGEPLAQMRPADVGSTALLGVDAAAIVMIVFGAWIVGAEYATGAIHTSLIATPNRRALFTAKITVTAVMGIVVGLLVVAVALAAAQVVLAAQGLPMLGLSKPQLVQMALGSVLMVPFYAVLAAAAAFLVRNSGGAVLIGLAVMFTPGLVGLLPDAWQGALLPLLPGSALMSISGVAEPGGAGHVAPALAVVSLVVWLTLATGAGLLQLAHRDA